MSVSIDDQENIGVEESPTVVNPSEDGGEEEKMIEEKNWTKIMMKLATGMKSAKEVIHFKCKYCPKSFQGPSSSNSLCWKDGWDNTVTVHIMTSVRLYYTKTKKNVTKKEKILAILL
jgi:hypothetical protein